MSVCQAINKAINLRNGQLLQVIGLFPAQFSTIKGTWLDLQDSTLYYMIFSICNSLKGLIAIRYSVITMPSYEMSIKKAIDSKNGKLPMHVIIIGLFPAQLKVQLFEQRLFEQRVNEAGLIKTQLFTGYFGKSVL